MRNNPNNTLESQKASQRHKSSQSQKASQKDNILPKLITLRGITTSRVEPALKGSKTQGQNPYPARVFLKKDCATCLSEMKQCFHSSNNTADIPVFFRIKEKHCQVKSCSECNYPQKGSWEKQANCQTKAIKHQVAEVWIKPKIKKGSFLQVQGHFDNPINSPRKSFTATSYQILTPELQQQIEIQSIAEPLFKGELELKSYEPRTK